MNNELITKTIKLGSEAETVTLTSIDERGYPRAVVMSNVKAESLNAMYFATSTDSKKVKHYMANSKAGVTYNQGLSLIGEIEIIKDNSLKKELWQDEFIQYFPKGETDPNYCILRFTTKEALVYIDDIFTNDTGEAIRGYYNVIAY